MLGGNPKPMTGGNPMSSMSFNDLDPAEDVAFPRIFPFDPEASPPAEPPPVDGELPPDAFGAGPDAPPPAEPLPGPEIAGDGDGDGDVDVDPADLVIDESLLDDEELLEADAPEPEEITGVEIGVD
jgi:hypothetical protein